MTAIVVHLRRWQQRRLQRTVRKTRDAGLRTRSLIILQAARAELFEYIEVFYNGQRRHSALGYLSPRAFERQRAQQGTAA